MSYEAKEQASQVLNRPFSRIGRLARHILKQQPHLTTEEAVDCARAEIMAEKKLAMEYRWVRLKKVLKEDS